MLKITKKFAATFRCAYLNPADKSLVVWHQERDKRGVEKEWATLHRLDLSIGQRGIPKDSLWHITRLGINTVFLLRLVAQAPRIEMWWDNTTEASKDKGLRIEGLVVYGALSQHIGGDYLCLNNIPGLISGEFFFNTEGCHEATTYETLAETRRWGNNTLLVED